MLNLSLGFSCQSRYLIDSYTAEFARYPFDYNITTRAALLAILSGERSLRLTEEAIDIFRMSGDRREGVHLDGVFYWHDFPIERTRLSPGWQAMIRTINDKYDALLVRFFETLSDKSIPKRLIVSNTQGNLDQFARDAGQFRERFGLDAQFLAQLWDALQIARARNIRITFVNRSIVDSERLCRETAGLPYRARFESRYAGPMSLPVHRSFAASFLFPRPALAAENRELDRIVGEYDGGKTIVRVCNGIAYAYDHDMPVAEVTPMPGGYMFSFAGTPELFATALYDQGDLRISDRQIWRRTDRRSIPAVIDEPRMRKTQPLGSL